MKYFLLAIKYHKDLPCENAFLEIGSSELPNFSEIRSFVAAEMRVKDVTFYMFQEITKANFDMLSNNSIVFYYMKKKNSVCNDYVQDYVQKFKLQEHDTLDDLITLEELNSSIIGC